MILRLFVLIFFVASISPLHLLSMFSDMGDGGFAEDTLPLPGEGDFFPDSGGDLPFDNALDPISTAPLPPNKKVSPTAKPSPAKTTSSPIPKPSSESDDSLPTTPQALSDEIKEERMEGEGILQLSEDQRQDLVPSGSPKIIYFFEQTKEIEATAQRITNHLIQQVQQNRNTFDQLEQDLDLFFQSSGAFIGKIETQLNPRLLPDNQRQDHLTPMPQATSPSIKLFQTPNFK